MTNYTPPAAVNDILDTDRLADPAGWQADADAAADAEFQKVLAHYAPRAEAVTVALVSVAAERVCVARGGYRGDLGRITGTGRAGGHVITTDSGETLYLAERDIVRLAAGE